MAPRSTDPDLGVLDELIKLCVDLDGCLHGSSDRAAPAQDSDARPPGEQTTARAPHARRVEELVREIIGKAAALLSGEAGLASFLRRNLLGEMSLGGPSLPLDVGDVDDIPWWIRRAVHTRDQKCRYDLCYYHHHILVHQKGWNIKARPDGTLEARSPDGRVFTEHTRPPPSGPG